MQEVREKGYKKMLTPKEVDPTLLDRLERTGDRLKKKKISLSKTAEAVINKRYLKKDSNGIPVETAEDMFWRVACNVAYADLHYNPWSDVEKRAVEFYEMMTYLDFLPNSPTLMNAGRELQQLSACFVLPIEDSMDSIFEAVKSTAIIHKTGGGTGFSFNKLRPKNDRVATTGGVASGPISFMKVFNAATDVIKQGGTRRGANMAILNVDHPDILEFISIKRDLEQLTNFNLSVGINQDFMKKAINRENYSLVNPSNGEECGQLNAGEVFDLIVTRSWESGEPGVVFIDRLNMDNPTPHIGSIESTNPCREQPLLPYEACNLGSINLMKMIKTDNEKAEIDYKKLEKTVKCAIRFLDNVIDVNKYPLKEIEKLVKTNRKIGLGVMGFADMLISLNVKYDSKDALKIAQDVMKFIQDEARKESSQIAKERGVFPNFDGSVYDVEGGMRLRNATVTTIAPTGTLSIIANCSSGIEPLFGICFLRRILDGDKFIEINPVFEQLTKNKNYATKELYEKIAELGTIKNLEEIPQDIRDIFATTYDVDPVWHINIQAAFQKYTDNAVSKTVNFPESATKEDIKKVFQLAYELDCKGVTIYRHNSRNEQVINIGNAEGKKTAKKDTFGDQQQISISNEKINYEDVDFEDYSSIEKFNNLIRHRTRPEIAFGLTEKINICGSLIYVTVNYDEYGICEVVIKSKESNETCKTTFDVLSRFITLAVSSRIQVNYVLNQLKGYKCAKKIGSDVDLEPSCIDEIARIIEKAWKRKANFINLAGNHSKYLSVVSAVGTEVSVFAGDQAKVKQNIISVDEYKETIASKKIETKKRITGKDDKMVCPECTGIIEYIEGCIMCRTCGFSKCG